VNATFYRPIEASMAEAWLRRTPESFLFSVKLYQKFTHPDMYLARGGVKDWDVSRADVDQFRQGVAPIVAAGRLGAVLIQFPPSFHAEPDTRAYLEWLLDAMKGMPIAVEVRHQSWNDTAHETTALLDAHGASLVIGDSPVSKGFDLLGAATSRGAAPRDQADLSRGSDPRDRAGVRPLFLRFHGRNLGAWWQHDEAEDRYDYLYSSGELAPFAGAVRQATASGRRVLAYFNNHFSAKAVANAAILKHQLGELVPGDYPVEMVRRYPELEGVVRTEGLPL
jgi:uncharacterized protein YecE (DUF72 family)